MRSKRQTSPFCLTGAAFRPGAARLSGGEISTRADAQRVMAPPARNGSLATPRPLKTVGSFWPYSTTLWDYINRSMPYDRPGTLTADEVYAVTAFVLHLNGIVGAAETLTQETLPRVRMPNRDGFIR